MKWHEILLWVFHSTFWAFLCISQDPLGRSLWSGHYWNDRFLLQKLRLCQFWSKVMTSEVEERPRLVTAGYGRHRSQWVKITVSYFSAPSPSRYWPHHSYVWAFVLSSVSLATRDQDGGLSNSTIDIYDFMQGGGGEGLEGLPIMHCE